MDCEEHNEIIYPSPRDIVGYETFIAFSSNWLIQWTAAIMILWKTILSSNSRPTPWAEYRYYTNHEIHTTHGGPWYISNLLCIYDTSPLGPVIFLSCPFSSPIIYVRDLYDIDLIYDLFVAQGQGRSYRTVIQGQPAKYIPVYSS